MTNTSQNFADNNQKKYARDFLVNVINTHFKSTEPRALDMLELLGTGIGTNHYLENINNLGSIDCIEIDKKQFGEYEITDDRVSLYNADLSKFIFTEDAKQYDIINLDFCAYFCESTMVTKISTGNLLRSVLESKKFKKNSIIFVTFLLDGYQIRVSQYKDDILTSPDAIIKRILKIGSEYKLDLSSLNSTFLYKPEVRGWNKMMHTGFVVNAM